MYFGNLVPGNSLIAGSVAFNFVMSVAIDCVRKSVFVSEFTGNIVKEVKLGTLVTTHVAGVYLDGSYNGPGPMVATRYKLSGVIEVRTFQDELYITSSVNNEVSTVGMSTTVNDAVACIKMTRTKTLATPAPVTPVPVTPTMDIMDDNVLTLGIVDVASPRGARGGPTMDIIDDNVLTLGIVDAASPRGARDLVDLDLVDLVTGSGGS